MLYNVYMPKILKENAYAYHTVRKEYAHVFYIFCIISC